MSIVTRCALVLMLDSELEARTILKPRHWTCNERLLSEKEMAEKQKVPARA